MSKTQHNPQSRRMRPPTPSRLFWRNPIRSIGPRRVLRGGRLNDAGRLPRYALLTALLLGGIWLPLSSFLAYAPTSFTSSVSLILPGSGAGASINLAEIGQASSSSSSAFSSSRISPTQTYKRLLTAHRVRKAAAEALDTELRDFGAPKIKLVDETSLIHFDMSALDPQVAQDRASALLDAFFAELDHLREDEIIRREKAIAATLKSYREDVEQIRAEITSAQENSGLVSFGHYNELVARRDTAKDVLADIAARRQDADNAMEALALQLNTTPEIAAANLRLHADPEFQELAKLFSQLSAEHVYLQGRFGSNHPQMTNALSKLNRAQRAIADHAMRVTNIESPVLQAKLDLSPDLKRGDLLAELVQMRATCKGLAAREAEQRSRLAEMNAEIEALAPIATRLDDLNRDYQVAEAVLTSATARADTAKSDTYASYPLVQVLQDASFPDDPSGRKAKIALAAGIAGSMMILLGMLLAWIRRPLIDRILVTADKD